MFGNYLWIKIAEMKAVFYIVFGFASVFYCRAEEDNNLSHFVANLNCQVVYRGVPNYFEFAVCDACDTVFITAIGAEILTQTSYSFEVVPTIRQRLILVSSNCVQGSDTILNTWRYNVRSIPMPNIYLGGNNLKNGLNLIVETAFFAQTRFSVRYDESVPLINIYFTVKEWSISAGKDTFTGTTAVLSAEYKHAFMSAKRKTAIQFNYVIIDFPDGRTEKIEFHSKTYSV